MRTQKILEAIAELELERSQIDDAISGLRRIVAKSGTAELTLESAQPQSKPKPVTPSRAPESYPQMVYAILTENRKAMHIDDLVAAIQERRGDVRIGRNSVESSLIRSMKFSRWKTKISRVSPGTFAAKE